VVALSNPGDAAVSAAVDGPDEQSICIGCGLCCDGTVVSHLAVRDESDLGAPLRGLGVEIIAAAEPPVFELPCPAVCDGVCTIHSLHRPSACSQYECKLSRAVLEGEVSAEEARSVISATLGSREQVRAGLLNEAVLQEMLTAYFRIGD
jgi:Fe-S-cluster containining protein